MGDILKGGIPDFHSDASGLLSCLPQSPSDTFGKHQKYFPRLFFCLDILGKGGGIADPLCLFPFGPDPVMPLSVRKFPQTPAVAFLMALQILRIRMSQL